jgi:hypothetical protein
MSGSNQSPAEELPDAPTINSSDEDAGFESGDRPSQAKVEAHSSPPPGAFESNQDIKPGNGQDDEDYGDISDMELLGPEVSLPCVCATLQTKGPMLIARFTENQNPTITRIPK